jgi:6-phosphogluconolactonase (cycloisomerase 2 family)
MGSPAVNPAVDGSYWPLTLSGPGASDVIAPTAVSVLTSGGNTYVYVSAYDSSVTPHVGYIFGFSVGSGGVLTPLSGSPFSAGIQPSAIAGSADGAYVYATDYVGGDVLGYSVTPSTSITPVPGTLVPLTTGTDGTNEFPAGGQPTAIALDSAYSYAYVVNSADSTVSAYSISGGTLNRLGSYVTGLQPVAVGIDPSTERFLFTADYLGGTVSGFELNPADGTLLDSQYSPYSSNAQPTAVAAIPHNGTGGGIQE